MRTIDYEALIEKRGNRDEAARRKQADKLAEIARNLETLHERAEEEEEEEEAKRQKKKPSDAG